MVWEIFQNMFSKTIIKTIMKIVLSHNGIIKVIIWGLIEFFVASWFFCDIFAHWVLFTFLLLSHLICCTSEGCQFRETWSCSSKSSWIYRTRTILHFSPKGSPELSVQKLVCPWISLAWCLFQISHEAEPFTWYQLWDVVWLLRHPIVLGMGEKVARPYSHKVPEFSV